MDKFEKFISVLEESLETYRSSDPSIALQKAIDAVKDEDDVCFGLSPSPIELFVGAKCLLRNGEEVTVVANDGASECNRCTTIFPFMTECGTKSYCRDGMYNDRANYSTIDIIRILNPQDRPSPVKYRQVNQFDVDKECEYWDEDSCSWKPCVLKGAFKTPAPDGCIASVYDKSTDEFWALEDDDVRIIAKDDDPVVKTGFINIYKGQARDTAGCLHASVSDAKESECLHLLSRVKIEYIDGQYDA